MRKANALSSIKIPIAFFVSSSLENGVRASSTYMKTAALARDAKRGATSSRFSKPTLYIPSKS